MARGGAREGAGRPKGVPNKMLNEENKKIKLFSRIPEQLDTNIETYGIGENKSEKIRYILEKGIEKIIEENQGN